MEQPTTFELIINLNTTRAVAVAMVEPPLTLSYADEVLNSRVGPCSRCICSRPVVARSVDFTETSRRPKLEARRT
jgi:hypothetical protein